MNHKKELLRSLWIGSCLGFLLCRASRRPRLSWAPGFGFRGSGFYGLGFRGFRALGV